MLDFFVSRHTDKAILGGQAGKELQLVRRIDMLDSRVLQQSGPPATKEEILKKYPKVFKGLEFRGVTHIQIDTAVTPVICMQKLLSYRQA